MGRRTSFSTLLLSLTAACGGNGISTPSLTLALRAEPPAFAPAATVRLLPVFSNGIGRIDPDVGPVVSGGSYVVGPVTEDRLYTLTIQHGNGYTETRVLNVPLRYRERIVELPPSPIARTRHGAATLVDGRVLLVGGASTGPVFWANAEVFGAGADFAPVGDLSTTRAESRVVALPDGGAFAFGGPTNASSFELATRVEQWDPHALAWSVRGNLACNRQRHTATRLWTGAVLLAGGSAVGGQPEERDAEMWLPGIGSRQPIGEMVHARAAHTATLLRDGRVLLAGGYDLATGEPVLGAEIFDPDLDLFLPTGNLAQGRFYHAAERLLDGRVLLVGGEVAGQFLASCEIFDPVTGLFTPTGPLHLPRSEVQAVRLAGGSVLVAGGLLQGGAATDLVEVWEPVPNAWRTWAARLPAPRSGHSLHLLPDARVVVLGGDPGTGFPVPTAWRID